MKKWYKSKTLRVNALAAIAMFVQSEYGFVVAPELQAYLLVVVNMILRTVTSEGIEA
jgi:hypothetical protein